MKLSLDELKVDSYAVQVSESELAEVKGGTGWVCVDLGIAVVNTIIAGYAAYNSGSGGTTTNGTNTTSGGSGCGGSSSASGGAKQTLYGIDSMNNQMMYGIDSLRNW
jgi:hypothetical protein